MAWNTAPYDNPHSHTHEWEFVPVDVEFFGNSEADSDSLSADTADDDETVAIYHRCTYWEGGHVHDAARDESYQNPTYECEATHITYFSPRFETWVDAEQVGMYEDELYDIVAEETRDELLSYGHADYPDVLEVSVMIGGIEFGTSEGGSDTLTGDEPVEHVFEWEKTSEEVVE